MVGPTTAVAKAVRRGAMGAMRDWITGAGVIDNVARTVADPRNPTGGPLRSPRSQKGALGALWREGGFAGALPAREAPGDDPARMATLIGVGGLTGAMPFIGYAAADGVGWATPGPDGDWRIDPVTASLQRARALEKEYARLTPEELQALLTMSRQMDDIRTRGAPLLARQRDFGPVSAPYAPPVRPWMEPGGEDRGYDRGRR